MKSAFLNHEESPKFIKFTALEELDTEEKALYKNTSTMENFKTFELIKTPTIDAER